MTPGETLRALRTHAGHTQAQAAEIIGAGSYRTIQDWEGGQRAVPAYALTLYALLTDQHDSLRAVAR